MAMAHPARRRPSKAARSVGYAFAAAGNIVFWLLVMVWPGWEVVPFLTQDVTQLLGLFGFSVLVSVVANLAWIVHDGPGFKALGELAIAAIGFALAWRVLVVFPFDFAGLGYDLTVLVRVVVVIGVVGSAIGVIAALVRLARAL